MLQARALLPEMDFATSAYECVEGAHAVALVTEWDEFRALDLARLEDALLAEPVLVDPRNIYPLGEAERHGLNYVSIGRLNN